jgi:hypothetical protein
MAQSNLPVMPTASVGPEPAPATWHEVTELLLRAARLAGDAGIESDPFMHAAWSAYLEARPGFRAVLEHEQLVAQLETLRTRGQLAQA